MIFRIKDNYLYPYLARMSFAISLTVFAFSTMDISDCLLNKTDANACLVESQTVYRVVHLVG